MTSDFSGMGSEMEIVKQLDTALEIAGASEVFLRIAGAESFYQVKRQIQGIGGILPLTHSQTLMGKQRKLHCVA